MNKVQIGKYKFNVPQGWHELTQKQFVYAVNALKAYSATDAKYKVLLALLPWHKRMLLDKLSAEQHLQLLDLLAWLPSQDISYGEFAFSKIRYKWFYTLHGPTDSLENVTVRQFAYADTYLNKYAKTPNNMYLAKFMGSLYFVNKARAHKNRFEDHIQKMLPVVANLDAALVFAVAFNFTAVRNYVYKSFEDSFSKSDRKSKADKYGFHGLVQLIASSRGVAPAQIYDMPLLEFFIQLDVQNIARKEQEAAKA